jgi:hypothetical protein
VGMLFYLIIRECLRLRVSFASLLPATRASLYDRILLLVVYVDSNEQSPLPEQKCRHKAHLLRMQWSSR